MNDVSRTPLNTVQPVITQRVVNTQVNTNYVMAECKTCGEFLGIVGSRSDDAVRTMGHTLKDCKENEAE